MTLREKFKPPAARSLFKEPERAANIYVANVDGASRGNPGPASYAVILRGPDGATKFEVGKYLGRATNNVAEYYALIAALDYAAANGIERLLVRSDSELLVRQMQGRYRVKSADLRPLYERAQKLARGLASFTIEHVPREQNREADELANAALDSASASAPRTAMLEESASARPVRTSEVRKAAASLPDGESEIAVRPNQRVRARYSAGALHPLAALDLTEGDIVELTIRPSRPAS